MLKSTQGAEILHFLKGKQVEKVIFPSVFLKEKYEKFFTCKQEVRPSKTKNHFLVVTTEGNISYPFLPPKKEPISPPKKEKPVQRKKKPERVSPAKKNKKDAF